MNTNCVIRGGSWTVVPRDVRSAASFWLPPDSRYVGWGFRLVQEDETPRVVRGGSWTSNQVNARSAIRYGADQPVYWGYGLGFRLLQEE